MKRKRWAFIWVRAEMASLSEISRFVQEWLSRQEGYRESQKDRYLVELAVIEGCTNIIRHGYPDASPGSLGVCLARAGCAIEVLLLDEGVPFDPTKADPPDLREPREGGYGIFLIHEIMRSVTYQRRGARWNCLHLVRDVPREGVDQKAKEGLRQRIVNGKEGIR